MSDRHLRVLYAALQDSSDIRQWSGLIHFIAHALEDQGCVLSYADQLQRPRRLINKTINKAYKLIGIPGLMPVDRSMRMARRIATDVAAMAERSNCDIIFSPSSIPVALLRSDRPTAFYTDCTFADLLDDYPELSDYPQSWRDEGHHLEHEALHHCDLAIYASDWAARSAVERYGADPAKVKVVPLGSNFATHPAREAVEGSVRSRPQSRCELLLIGVNWERKGGPLAWEVTRALNAAGLDTRLTVLGCIPPEGMAAPFLRVLKFIDKGTPEGQQEIQDLMLRSNFLFVPSVAECFGIIYAEASAMGLPSLARDVGGVGSAVIDGRNGVLFPASAPVDIYVQRIRALFNDKATYEKLALSAYEEFTSRLNWKTSGAALHTLLRDLR